MSVSHCAAVSFIIARILPTCREFRQSTAPRAHGEDAKTWEEPWFSTVRMLQPFSVASPWWLVRLLRSFRSNFSVGQECLLVIHMADFAFSFVGRRLAFMSLSFRRATCGVV